jgi:hypothetical protein
MTTQIAEQTPRWPGSIQQLTEWKGVMRGNREQITGARKADTGSSGRRPSTA